MEATILVETEAVAEKNYYSKTRCELIGVFQSFSRLIHDDNEHKTMDLKFEERWEVREVVNIQLRWLTTDGSAPWTSKRRSMSNSYLEVLLITPYLLHAFLGLKAE